LDRERDPALNVIEGDGELLVEGWVEVLVHRLRLLQLVEGSRG